MLFRKRKLKRLHTLLDRERQEFINGYVYAAGEIKCGRNPRDLQRFVDDLRTKGKSDAFDVGIEQAVQEVTPGIPPLDPYLSIRRPQK